MNNTIVSSASILGVLIGSFLAGYIVKDRRKTLIAFNMLAAVGTGLCLILNFASIVAGRFIFGFCNGIFFVAGPKMLDETIPASHIGVYGTATNTFLSVGITTSMLLGLILPDDGDTEGQFKDENWRVIYGFPLICQTLQVFFMLTVYRDDSIINCIEKGNYDGALRTIKRIYSKEEDHAEILVVYKLQASEKQQSQSNLGDVTALEEKAPVVSLLQAVCDP